MIQQLAEALKPGERRTAKVLAAAAGIVHYEDPWQPRVRSRAR
jgi:hypothetical protein